MLDPFDSCRFCEWLQALFTSSLPCLTPVIMVLTCYTNIFLQHLLCPALSLWPRRSSPQIICPQIICYICQLCLMATVDLLSKGDTQKGWEKVTGTSVMDVLKWRTGGAQVSTDVLSVMLSRCLSLVWCSSVTIFHFFHLAHAASKTRILFLWMPNVETHMSVDSPQYHCRVQFVSELLSSGWTMEYYHHYAWPEQICTSVWHSWGQG